MKKALILASLIVIIAANFCFYQPNSAQAAYGLSENIKQVKTAADPAVYYLDHKRGVKKLYASEKAFLSYGNKWSDIKILSQEQLDKWPEMHLAKSNGSNKVYYVNNGRKALIESEQEFIDCGFNWQDIVTIAQADLNEYQLADFDSPGLLKIELASLNLSSLYLPTGSRGNAVAAFKFAALGGEAKITQLTFTQQGVSSDEIIEAAYLSDEAGVIYGDRYALNNKHLYLNLSGQPIIIPAGENKNFYLKVDLKPVAGATGQTLKFGLINSLDIAVASQLVASFPLAGPEFRLADGVSNLGKIKATSITLNTSGDQANIGATNKTLAAFRLAEASGNEDVLIKNITLTNIGSAQDSDLRDLVLVDQDGKQLMKIQAMGGQKVSFRFEPGYLIRKNHYLDLKLKAAVVSGDGRDIKFAISNDNDITAMSKENGYSLAITNNSASASQVNRFAIVRTPIFLTTSVLKVSESLIYRDQRDAVLGSFELRNNISDVKLSSFTIAIIKSSGAPSLDQPLVAVEAKSGAVLGTIDAQKITNNFADINLGNFEAAKGKTVKIKFTSHIPDTAPSGSSYVIYVKSVNYRIAENNIVYSDQVELSGQKIQVIKPTLYLYSGKLEKDDIAVAGDDQVYLGFFKVEATDEEHIRVTSLTVANAAGSTPLNYANGFTNLALYKSGYRVSDFIAEPNANSYTFEDLSIYVGAGTSADLYVRADVAANATGKVKLVLENAVAEDYVSGIPGEVNNKNVVSPEVALSQTALEIRSLSGGQITKGERTNQIASFSIINKSLEKVRINHVTLNSSGFLGNLSSNNGFSNLRFGYADERGRIISVGSWVKPVADVNEISLGSFTYDPGESFTINLYVDAANDAVTGNINLFIRDIQAKGQLSDVNASISGLPTDAVTVSVN